MAVQNNFLSLRDKVGLQIAGSVKGITADFLINTKDR